MRVALSIAGSDPTGGAGLQSDLQVFRACGVHGAGVVTALTVQDGAKLHQVLPVFPSVVLDQIRVAVHGVRPDAVKLGVLASDDVARAVAHGLDALEAVVQVPLVVDPVLAASDGTPLLERRALPTLCSLIGRAALVTPNLAEAETLAGRDVSTRQGVEAAAHTLVDELGAAAALVTGGHADGDPDDCLAERDRSGGVSVRWLPGERIPGGAAHGTGCALSAAVTAGLAQGQSLVDAVDAARRRVADALRGAVAVESGARFLGLR